jgi:hypothetical protein
MKKLGFAGVLAVIALLFATTAFAAQKGNMKLFDATLVNGVQLAPGDYAVQWQGTGSDVQLQILQGKKVVATAPAALVQLKSAAPQDLTSTARSEGSNTKTLTQIQFRGRNYALAIANHSSEGDVAKK